MSALLLVASGCGGSGGGNGGGGNQNAGKFIQTNLVGDTGVSKPSAVDPKLLNPWGIAFTPTGPFLIADNGSGIATTYQANGQGAGVVIQVAGAAKGINAPVSGAIYNPTNNFPVPNQGPATYIFCAEDGTVSAWEGGASSTVVVNRSKQSAVYKGLAMALNGGANFLYVANFNSGLIDVFDGNFNYVSSFADSNVPNGFAPFGIRTFNGLLYVTFAKQDAAKHDDVAGPGNGYLDVFTPGGSVSKRLVLNGPLNSPWGMEIAPNGFGSITGDLLVGNFGDGRVNAFNISTGAFDGPLLDGNANPIVIPGLWALTLGNGVAAGSSGAVYFTSGPNREADGLLGDLTPAGTPGTKRK